MSTTNERGGIRALVVPPAAESYVTWLGAGQGGSVYEDLSDLVDGCIESMSYLFGDEPAVYVNDEGLLRPDLEPNRAIYATAKMAREGYASRFDHGTVREGEFFDFIKGNMVCVGFDPRTGESRDISDDEIARVRSVLDTPRSIASARIELVVQGVARDEGLVVEATNEVRERLYGLAERATVVPIPSDRQPGPRR